MGISKFLRSASHGVASVGRAVQSASRKLDEAVAGQPHPMSMQPQVPMDPATMPAGKLTPPQPTQAPAAGGMGPSQAALGNAAPAAPTATPAEGAPVSPSQAATASTTPTASTPSAPRGFTLPDIGVAPLETDPKYAGDEGKKKYASDMEGYQHKQDIHQAFQDLEKIYAEAHPGRDFQKEYEDEVSMRNQHDKERPHGNGLARFALALGDQNPAVRQSGRSNLDEYNKSVDQEGARSDQGFSQRLSLRMKMHEAAASEAEQAGNWKKALAEQEKLALLAADEKSLAHSRDMEKVTAQQKGASDRAAMRRDAVENSAKIRARSIADTHGLSGTFRTAFEKAAASALGRRLGPRDLMKDYSTGDLDSVTEAFETLAETFHDQQYGDGSADTYLNQHPKKRKPASTEKPKF